MSDPTSPVAPKESESSKREKMIAQLSLTGAVVPFAQTLGANTTPSVPVESSSSSEPSGDEIPLEDEEDDENPVERAIKDTAFQIKTIDNYLKIIHDTNKNLLKAFSDNQESVAQLQLIMATELKADQRPPVVLPSPAPVAKAKPGLVPWIVAGAVCFGIGSLIVSRTLFSLQQKMETQYRDKLTRLESITSDNRKTLQLLGDMGIKLEIRKPESGNGYFLLFKGSQQVETGIDSPEGPNVKFYPR